jgi:tetratricopeptide (TPR) repeat protein
VHAALALFRACDDAAGLAACLAHAAVVDAWVGRFPQAAVTGDQAIRLATRTGDDAAIAVALTERVVAAADFKDASVQAHRAVSALHRTGNLFDLGVVCSVAGYLAIRERQYREALAWLDEAVDAARRLEDPRSILRSRGNQGLARLFVNDLDGAQAAFSDALASHPEAAGEHLLAHTLLGMAAVAARRGQITRAAQLAGAARRHAIGTPHRHEQVIWTRVDAEILAPVRAASDGDAWDRDERKGASLTAAEGIRLARCRP